MGQIDTLLHKALSGDKSAETELFGRLRDRFSYITKRYIRNTAEAEDVAQEACLTVFEKYKTEQFTVGFQAWACGVLRMKIGNYLQKRRTEKKRMATGIEKIASLESASVSCDPDLSRAMIACVKKLSRSNIRYARILLLVFNGYKTAEICAKLGVTPNVLYVSANRGRSLLKACLDGKEVM